MAQPLRRLCSGFGPNVNDPARLEATEIYKRDTEEYERRITEQAKQMAPPEYSVPPQQRRDFTNLPT